MKLTHRQRVNNVSAMIVGELRATCEKYRQWLKDGVPLQAGGGMTDSKVTPEELREALDENLKDLETVIEFVLDGKSNRITKPGEPEQPEQVEQPERPAKQRAPKK